MMISTMKKNTIFFWLLLFLVGILDSNFSAAAVEESITTTKTNTKNNANTSIPHYSLPPCSRDERQIFVNSHNYIMCAPICTDNENCPLDVPKGITMVRMGKAICVPKENDLTRHCTAMHASLTNMYAFEHFTFLLFFLLPFSSSSSKEPICGLENLGGDLFCGIYCIPNSEDRGIPVENENNDDDGCGPSMTCRDLGGEGVRVGVGVGVGDKYTGICAYNEEDCPYMGKPPCKDDEQAVSFLPLAFKYVFCTPECTGGGNDACPSKSELPRGVEEEATCSLTADSGQQYCSLMCQPTEEEKQKSKLEFEQYYKNHPNEEIPRIREHFGGMTIIESTILINGIRNTYVDIHHDYNNNKNNSSSSNSNSSNSNSNKSASSCGPQMECKVSGPNINHGYCMYPCDGDECFGAKATSNTVALRKSIQRE